MSQKKKKLMLIFCWGLPYICYERLNEPIYMLLKINYDNETFPR